MTNLKAQRALIAYSVLAERLRTPGMSLTQALTPFWAEICTQFPGELFDAEKFSKVASSLFGIRIPRLAVLGLAEQLAKEGLLITVSGSSSSTVYKYSDAQCSVQDFETSALTEADVTDVLKSFVDFAKSDQRFNESSEEFLHSEFLNRLLNVDSMKILARRDASIAAKRGRDTLVLKRPSDDISAEERNALHLDFLVSEFLLELRSKNSTGFERVSNVAFANMAAEAVACFRDPPTSEQDLSGLTVYLDSPLLLDMLGVNTEYAKYGSELLAAIKGSGAIPAVFDHCIAEAETAVFSKLNYLRSGVNSLSSGWGTSVKPDLLAALSGNIAARTTDRLVIKVHRDPTIDFLRRSQTTVGDIEAEIQKRMQAWRNSEAKEYDRKSVWAMIGIRDASSVCTRICDAHWLLLTRNTPLVSIANNAWTTWLQGTTKHSKANIDRWVPVAMSDKQFAGYLWARKGGSDGEISQARLLAHCSAAVRPRSDVKARAYNLVLELSGQEEANDLVALMEDREGARALMLATRGDPADVTKDRLPFILESIKLAAGEYAASVAREEGERKLQEALHEHEQKLAQTRQDSIEKERTLEARIQSAEHALIQHGIEQQSLMAQNEQLKLTLDALAEQQKKRRHYVFLQGLAAGSSIFKIFSWGSAAVFGVVSGVAAWVSSTQPLTGAAMVTGVAISGFWFVPSALHRPINRIAMRKAQKTVSVLEPGLELPMEMANFQHGRMEDSDGTVLTLAGVERPERF